MAVPEWNGDWPGLGDWARALFPLAPLPPEEGEDEEEEEEVEENEGPLLSEGNPFSTDPDDPDGAFVDLGEEEEEDEDDEDEEEDDEDALDVSLFPSKIKLKIKSGPRDFIFTDRQIDCTKIDDADAAAQAVIKMVGDYLIDSGQDPERARIVIKLIPFHQQEDGGKHYIWEDKDPLVRQFERAVPVAPRAAAPRAPSYVAPAAPPAPRVAPLPPRPRDPVPEIPELPARRADSFLTGTNEGPNLPAEEDIDKDMGFHTAPVMSASSALGAGGLSFGDITASLKEAARENPMVAMGLTLMAMAHEKEQQNYHERRFLTLKIVEQAEKSSTRITGVLDNIARQMNDERIEARRDASRKETEARRESEARILAERESDRNRLDGVIEQINERLDEERDAREAADQRWATERRELQKQVEAKDAALAEKNEALRTVVVERERAIRKGRAKPEEPQVDMADKIQNKVVDVLGNVFEQVLTGDGEEEEEAAAPAAPAPAAAPRQQVATRQAQPAASKKAPATREGLKGPLGAAASAAGFAGNFDPASITPDKVAVLLQFMPESQRKAFVKAIAKSDRDFAVGLAHEMADEIDVLYPELAGEDEGDEGIDDDDVLVEEQD